MAQCGATRTAESSVQEALDDMIINACFDNKYKQKKPILANRRNKKCVELRELVVALLVWVWEQRSDEPSDQANEDDANGDALEGHQRFAFDEGELQRRQAVKFALGVGIVRAELSEWILDSAFGDRNNKEKKKKKAAQSESFLSFQEQDHFQFLVALLVWVREEHEVFRRPTHRPVQANHTNANDENQKLDEGGKEDAWGAHEDGAVLSDGADRRTNESAPHYREPQVSLAQVKSRAVPCNEVLCSTMH